MKATIALATANVAVFLVMVVAHPSELAAFSLPTLLAYGGERTSLLREGEWWRLASAPFVHASPVHILWNMAVLVTVGRYLEPRYGATRVLATFGFGALAGSLVSAAWYWRSDVVAVGASGAILALIGAGTVSAWRMGERGREFRNAMLLAAAATVINGAILEANNAAHLGGLASGAALALVFGRRRGAPDIAFLAASPPSVAAPRIAVPPPGPAVVSYCGTCGTRRVGGTASCGACGAPYEVTCLRCGRANPPRSAFCGSCGAGLADAIGPPRPRR